MMSQITDTVVNFASTDGDGNCVSVTGGNGSQVLRDRWGQKTSLEGTDGDGYSLCGNGRGWVNFPLPCISPTQKSDAVFRRIGRK